MALSIKLVRLRSPGSVQSPELKKIAAQSSRGEFTEHHVLKIDGQEVCFLAYDVRPDQDCLILCELFLPRKFRRSGIGVLVLLVTEMYANRRGLTRIRLTPSPLDREIDRDDLIKWYRSHGYKKAGGKKGDLEKTMLTFKPNKFLP